jgi:hypothetical protein
MNLHYSNPSHRRSEGSAVIVVVAILALLLMFSTANRITLNVLAGELELIDQRQQRRIRQCEPSTQVSQPSAIHVKGAEDPHGSH